MVYHSHAVKGEAEALRGQLFVWDHLASVQRYGGKPRPLDTNTRLQWYGSEMIDFQNSFKFNYVLLKEKRQRKDMVLGLVEAQRLPQCQLGEA